MTSLANELDAIPEKGKLHRSISWVGAFWVASGVPALVLFSIGGIAGTAGNLAFLIWAASIALGFVKSFTYAGNRRALSQQIGGRLDLRRGSVGALVKFVAPLSVWCNWIAWSPSSRSVLHCGGLCPDALAPFLRRRARKSYIG